MCFMRMFVMAAIFIGAAAAGLCVTTTEDFDKGIWSASWPKALEPYRAQARTHIKHHAYLGTTNETAYEIEFKSREEFEKAWPAILEVKDKGAPILLATPPAFHDILTGQIDAGVRIWAPTTGSVYLAGDWKFGPPWPKSALLPNGLLPEYVTPDREKNIWRPFKESKDGGDFLGMRWRARTEIELVVDGKIVDLNRIQFPPDTPIIDNRKL